VKSNSGKQQAAQEEEPAHLESSNRRLVYRWLRTQARQFTLHNGSRPSMLFFNVFKLCPVNLRHKFWWKQIVILDIFCIAIGFLLRLEAGGAAFATPVSEWLFLTVFFLALFLGAGKRLAEKKLYVQMLQHIGPYSHNTGRDFLRVSCL